MEILTRLYAKNLVEWARNKPEVVVLSADLTGSTEIDLFRDTFPQRFFSMGMAEQNMISFAGGLAREGFFPFVHTFAVFIYRRALDQVSMSVAYPNLPVRMFGFLPGITTPGGATHQATDDIAIMRALPNMTILETGDATDVESVLDVAHQVPGPVYIRMLRGEIPRLFPRGEPLVLNRARVLNRGTDIALLSSGICTGEAMRATQALVQKGLSIQHLHVSTLKPFTDDQVMQAIERVRFGVITLENHSIIGGLGTATAECMAELGSGKKLVRLGLRDTYAHGASQHYLMKEYGLDAFTLVKTMEEMVGEKFNVGENELVAMPLGTSQNEAKVEDL